MASIFDRIYRHSPILIQNIGISAYGYIWRRRRYGGNFLQYVDEFTIRDRFSSEEFQRYQTEKLQKLLVYAEKNVPYYRDSFREAGLLRDQLSTISLDKLSTLPLLEKETIRSDPEKFTSKIINKSEQHRYLTSGTTGTPLAIIFTNDMHRRWSAAYEVRVRHWAGVNFKMSRAMIGGRLVVPQADAQPPFWRYNLAERQLYMSAFHISPKTVRLYAQALNHYQPNYLDGYASSHFFLARMIKEQGLSMYHPKAILTSSEKLTPEMRSIMEEVYCCKVFDGYSGLEACCLASECEYHNLHVSPDVGIIELLDGDGKPVGPGEVGEIVATGLLNFEQPLIRYRSGDLAIWSDETCGCGRNMPVIKELVGRIEDTVIGQDGREMVRFHGIFVGLPHVREGQVIQETLTQFRLKLIVDPDFSEHDRQIIIKRFEDRLGSINLAIELVDTIERTKRGKFQAVISKVKRNTAS